MFPLKLVPAMVAVLMLISGMVYADEQLPTWLLGATPISSQEANILSAIASRFNERYMRTSRSTKRGRELFGKRSIGASMNEDDAAEVMRLADNADSWSSGSYSTPPEPQQLLLEIVSNVADEIRASDIESERMPAIRLLKLPVASEPEFSLHNQAGLNLRQRRGKNRELFG